MKIRTNGIRTISCQNFAISITDSEEGIEISETA